MIPLRTSFAANAVKVPSTPRNENTAKKPRTDESRIKVVVRKRPLSKSERQTTQGSIIEVHEAPPTGGPSANLTIHEPKLKVDMTAYTEQHKVCRRPPSTTGPRSGHA